MDDPIIPKRPALTPEDKAKWNAFIEFVATQKMAGNPTLDQRNKNVGLMLMNKFNMANPKMQLSPDIIPVVQQEIQDYRKAALDKIKAGKAVFEGKEEDFMGGISPIDGWPGTKTLSTRFPVATMTTTTPTQTVVKEYGTDVGAYDKDRGIGMVRKP